MTPLPVEENDAAGFVFWLRFWRWVIALLEVVGGLTGIYVVAFGNIVGTGRAIFLLMFVLFVASVWGGILLALNKPGGVLVSLVIQALQVLQVSTTGLLYSFVCGLQLLISLQQGEDGPGMGVNVFFPAKFMLFFSPKPTGVASGVDVVAVLSIICLLYVRAEGRHQSRPNSTLPAATVAPPPSEGIWPPAPKS